MSSAAFREAQAILASVPRRGGSSCVGPAALSAQRCMEANCALVSAAPFSVATAVASAMMTAVPGIRRRVARVHTSSAAAGTTDHASRNSPPTTICARVVPGAVGSATVLAMPRRTIPIMYITRRRRAHSPPRAPGTSGGVAVTYGSGEGSASPARARPASGSRFGSMRAHEGEEAGSRRRGLVRTACRRRNGRAAGNGYFSPRADGCRTTV